MKIKYISLSFLILILLFFTGCTQNTQLHQKLMVQGIAVDMEDEEYMVTVQALDFQNPADKDEPNLKIVEVRGDSVFKALDEISKRTSLTAVYSQNLIVIIGEDVAKNGINNFIDFFIRHYEARPKVKLCVAEGKASEILSLKPDEKPDTKPIKAKDIHELIPEELNSDVLHFVGNLKSKISDPFMACLKAEEKAGKKSVVMNGIAIFKDDILTEFLKENLAFGFMLMKGVPKFGSCFVETEEAGDVTFTISKVSSKISAALDEDVPVFDINIKVGAYAFSMDKNFYTYEDEYIKNILKEKLSDKVSEFCRLVIDNIILNQSDILNFGKILKNSNPAYFKNIDKNWKEHLRKCRFNINKDVNVVITGKEPV